MACCAGSACTSSADCGAGKGGSEASAALQNPGWHPAVAMGAAMPGQAWQAGYAGRLRTPSLPGSSCGRAGTGVSVGGTAHGRLRFRGAVWVYRRSSRHASEARPGPASTSAKGAAAAAAAGSAGPAAAGPAPAAATAAAASQGAGLAPSRRWPLLRRAR